MEPLRNLFVVYINSRPLWQQVDSGEAVANQFETLQSTNVTPTGGLSCIRPDNHRQKRGDPGHMRVLSTASKLISGKATEPEQGLREYCEADVKDMYEIATTYERILYLRTERRERRRI